VFVAAVFRAPTLTAPTLGEIPKDVSTPSDSTPFPIATVTPPYPPTALVDGVVLTEVHVGLDGRVGDVRVTRSAPPFDEAASQAARGWVFRPARVRGRLVPTLAYIAFAFRQPVTGG
jgi:TonB family protein